MDHFANIKEKKILKKKVEEISISCCVHLGNREQLSIVLSDLCQAVEIGDLRTIGQ